ncbi:MAG: hypothetical protein ABWW65_06060 [Thermoprotei archaeon]
MREKIGRIREVSREKIGRIYPKDEAMEYGYKVKAEAEKKQ